MGHILSHERGFYRFLGLMLEVVQVFQWHTKVMQGFRDKRKIRCQGSKFLAHGCLGH